MTNEVILSVRVVTVVWDAGDGGRMGDATLVVWAWLSSFHCFGRGFGGGEQNSWWCVHVHVFATPVLVW
jgi:hypothetical protein